MTMDGDVISKLNGDVTALNAAESFADHDITVTSNSNKISSLPVSMVNGTLCPL